MSKKLTIIIVTFESEKLIKNCLENINFDKYEVFVVDNNSKDGTTKVIEEQFPKTRLIKLNNNIGYGKANNVALEQTETKYALILNPDAIIKDGDIENAIEILENNQDIAIAGPIILQEKEQTQKNLSNKKGYNTENLNKEILEKNKDFFFTEFVSGSVLFLRMSVFRKIGFFDDNLFLFREDDEICLRSTKNGYKNAVITKSFAIHLEGTSSKINYRNIYRKSWHFYWSKCYWQSLISKNNSKFYSLILVFKCFLKLIISIFRLNFSKIVKYIAAISGSFFYLINLKPFKKNGKARG